MKEEDFKVRSHQRVFQGNILSLDLEDVEFPDGEVRRREVVRHVGAVGVVPITDDGEVLLLRQYRQPVGGFILEIPAGIPEEGESPEECARRELREETGAETTFLRKLGEFYTTPGYSDELFHLFFARVKVEGRLELDADEFLEVVPLPVAEAEALLDQNQIEDAKTMIGLLMLRRAGGVLDAGY